MITPVSDLGVILSANIMTENSAVISPVEIVYKTSLFSNVLVL